MPRVEHPKHRVQRAFAPLLLRAPFQPERLLAHPPLPWLATFSPHIDGQLPNDDGFAEGASTTTATIKMKRPNGEPGRTGDCGFNLKSALNLPSGMYEEMIVRFLFHFPITSDSDQFHRMKSIVLV
jgi:hypothetical protein